MIEATTTRCSECAHHERTEVFDLCKHSASKYSIAGKEDFHTIGHMRTRGACRDGGVMFSPITVTRAKKVRAR